MAEDAQAAEKVALTDAEREAVVVALRMCRVDDGAPVPLLKEHDLPHVTWMVTQAVEHIVATRVAEAVDRERAAWAAKIAALADEWPCEEYDEPQTCITAGPEVLAAEGCLQCRVRALLSADDTEAERGALHDVLAERWTQVAKGYTPEHDDEHPLGQLLGYGGLQWYPVTHSPQDRAKIRAEMIRAGACLLAGIEWIDRRLAADATKSKP